MSEGPPTMNLCAAATSPNTFGSQWGRDLNNLTVRKDLPTWRNDEQGPLERATPPALVAVRGLRHGLAMETTPPPTADPPTRDAAVDTEGVSGVPASARAVQRRWPGTDPNQPSGTKALASDPALVVPVIASPAEVFRARELREQLRKRYANHPGQPCSLWCVGID